MDFDARTAPVSAKTMSAILVMTAEIIQTKAIALIISIDAILRMGSAIGVCIVEINGFFREAFRHYCMGPQEITPKVYFSPVVKVLIIKFTFQRYCERSLLIFEGNVTNKSNRIND
jgi:hypothetical protein